MFQLTEENAPAYLRDTGRASAGEILVQSLSGGIANTVLKIFDTAGGPSLGSDVLSLTPDAGAQQQAARQGLCLVLKQPLPQFRTAAEWKVDIARVLVERDCIQLLSNLLPKGSVPDVLWCDEPDHILAISCAPVDAVLWKKSLLAGHASVDAATHAGMLLAMLHSATYEDAAIAARYGDPHLFTQQRIDPYLLTTAEKHPALQPLLAALAHTLTTSRLCLIHGDFSPKNIFLVPARREDSPAAAHPKTFDVSHLLLLDFEVAFYGHPAFDVATLLNHFLLKAFYHRNRWRPFMVLADTFWDTYRHTAAPDLVRAASAIAGRVLGALMLARVDGKSPAEYLDAPLQEQVRRAAVAALGLSDPSLDAALDVIPLHFDAPD